MGLGQITKQELSTELYNDLKQEELQLNATPADVEISGRTLVNLLGRAGNAIYKQVSGFNATITHESDKFVVDVANAELEHGGLNAIGGMLKNILKPNKFYVVICDNENITTTQVAISVYNILNYKTSSNTSIGKGVSYVGFKTPEAIHDATYVDVFGYGKGKKCNVSNVRLYEITEAEYNKINADAEYIGDKLADKFPYVDDVKCVVNPYVECKENLLDGIFVAQGGTREDGTLDIPVSSSQWVVNTLSIPIEPNTTYTLERGNIPTEIELYAQVLNYENFYGSFDTNNNTFVNLVIDCKTVDKAKDIVQKINSREWRPILTKGSTPKNYDECHNSRMMFETKLYDGERITRDNSGRYVKNSEWDEVIFDESVDYRIHRSIVTEAHKQIKIDNITLPRSEVDTELIQYTGKLTPKYTHTVDKEDALHYHGDNRLNRNVYFSLPNNLTGWGDGYTPTPEEIRAFFLGWRMYDGVDNSIYNRADGVNKSWIKLWCGIGEKSPFIGEISCVGGTGNTTTVCPTTMNDMGYTPYRLIYKKETSIIEEVKVHGSLVIKDGADVNVSSGLVLDEMAKVSSNNTRIHTNGGDSKWANRCETPLAIRVNNVHKTFTINNFSGDNLIIYGVCNVWFGMRGEETLKEGEKSLSVDYLIYRPDTVTSFPYSIITPQTTQETLEKTIEELSNTNEKLSAENRELKNKIENLPQASNPNLLINGDFQVWQRGVRFENLAGYGVDRWYSTRQIPNGALTITEKTDDGIKLTATGEGVNYLYYKMEETKKKKLHGQKVTLSFCIKTAIPNQSVGVVKSENGKQENLIIPTPNQFVVYSKTFILDEKQVHDICYFRAEGSTKPVELKWVKLELGDKATPFVPRPYGEELALCQRYYEKQSLSNNYAVGFLHNETSARIMYKFTTEKRTRPTIRYGTGFRVQVAGGATQLTNISTLDSDLKGVFIQCTLATNGLNGSGCILQRNDQSTDFIEVDAEIY